MIPPTTTSLLINLTGTLITIIASAYNAIGQHRRAIALWRYSNICMFVLFVGVGMDWWVLNSGAWIQAGVYGVFIVLNEYAIRKVR